MKPYLIKQARKTSILHVPQAQKPGAPLAPEASSCCCKTFFGLCEHMPEFRRSAAQAQAGAWIQETETIDSPLFESKLDTLSLYIQPKAGLSSFFLQS